MAENNEELVEDQTEVSKALSSIRAKATSLFQSNQRTMDPNPWNNVVDILGSKEDREYRNTIKDCRFFYRHDPLAATVINKMVDLAINELIVSTDDLTRVSQTEEAIFRAVADDMENFIRKAAYEYLLTGLVVPEIKLNRINQTELRRKDIPRLSSLLYPNEMWLRDPKNIEIKSPPIGGGETYFVRLPEDVLNFIKNKGEYDDGTEDRELYRNIVRHYPEFVKQIQEGEDKVKLDNPLIIKSNTLTDSQYPIPYLNAALEPLRHKRNLRRMDYSLAARVITAILHAKMGNDEFPLTEDQEEQMDAFENKFEWRQNLGVDDIERVFLLITNHTIDLEWVLPDVEALLDDTKYQAVNQDIIVALGFPRILITGETERSFASDPQIATISPLHTMKKLQKALLPIIKTVYYELQKNNDSVSNVPELRFKPINLMSMQLFVEGIKGLYETGNLSRESFAEAFGYHLDEELKKRSKEEEKFEDMDLEKFQPVPHSNEPGRPTGSNPPESAPEGD